MELKGDPHAEDGLDGTRKRKSPLIHWNKKSPLLTIMLERGI